MSRDTKANWLVVLTACAILAVALLTAGCGLTPPEHVYVEGHVLATDGDDQNVHSKGPNKRKGSIDGADSNTLGMTVGVGWTLDGMTPAEIEASRARSVRLLQAILAELVDVDRREAEAAEAAAAVLRAEALEAELEALREPPDEDYTRAIVASGSGLLVALAGAWEFRRRRRRATEE